MLTGQFGYDASLKEHPSNETVRRLIASFDARGDVFAFDVAKGDTGSRRAFLKCVDDARKEGGFRVCGDPRPRQVLWQFGTERVSYELCGNGTDIVGKTYFARACEEGFISGARWLTFNIASQDAPRGIEALVDCSCDRMIADRLSFDPQLRTVSFNLDTDAKVIKFAGGEFHVPTITSRSHDGKQSMQIPVFTIRFNEHWQVVEITAVGGDAPAAQRADNPG
jgi:hypothetical protein